MPSFSGYVVVHTAKGSCVIDGEIFTTDSSNGHTVPTFPSSYSAFLGVPVRSATGVWSVTMKDPAYKSLFCHVEPLQALAAPALRAVMQAPTTDSVGRQVLNWTFVAAGGNTATDIAASQQFQVTNIYSETSIS